jgi:hypothetical protein
MPRLLHLRTLLLLTLAVFLALSCGRPSRRGGTPCFDSGDCNDEAADVVDIEACIDGECEDVDCLSSADCVVGQYCDLEDGDYACREGCQEDRDCFAGQSCQDGTCQTYGCRSTILDCDFNEICDTDSGQCMPASGLQCTGCDPSGNYRDTQGTTNTCDDTIGGNQLCGGDGTVCAGDQFEAICWTACDAPGEPDQCPAGFSCGFASWEPGIGCAAVPLGPYCVPTDGCAPNSP